MQDAYVSARLGQDDEFDNMEDEKQPGALVPSQEGGGDEEAKEVQNKVKREVAEREYYKKNMLRARRLTRYLPHTEVINLIDQCFQLGRFPKKNWIKPKRTFHPPMAVSDEIDKFYPARGLEDDVDNATGEEFMIKIERYKKMVGGIDEYDKLAAQICSHRIFNPRCANCGKCDPSPMTKRHFQYCSRCGLVFYCSKTCTHKYHQSTHRDICLAPNAPNPYNPVYEEGYLSLQLKQLANGQWTILYKNEMKEENEEELARLPNMHIQKVQIARKTKKSKNT